MKPCYKGQVKLELIEVVKEEQVSHENEDDKNNVMLNDQIDLMGDPDSHKRIGGVYRMKIMRKNQLMKT